MQDEIHAFPLFWQHPVRRILGPFNLHWLFELLYPVPKVSDDAIWQDIVSPRKTDLSKSTRHSPCSPVVDSLKADSAIGEIAHFISQEYESMHKLGG